MVGRFREARATISRSVDMYDEIGAFGHASRVRSVAAEVELLAGDPAAAEEKLIEIYQLREQRSLKAPSEWLDLFLARVLCEQSRYQEALPLVEAGWEIRRPRSAACGRGQEQGVGQAGEDGGG